MVERAKALCAKYVPDKIINETQAEQLAHSIGANALIGREKSAVLVRINPKNNKQDWRMIIFHELMHIFCAKSEMDGEHFIDIYGSGHTPDMNPADKAYDGFLNAGYVVWSEFIAQYYALKETETEAYSFADIIGYASSLLREVNIAGDECDGSKSAFAMACAYLMTCDGGDVLSNLVEPDEIDPNDKNLQMTLRSCLEYLNSNLQREKPWKINEEFISTLGSKFLMFKVANSFNTGL